MRSDGKGLYYYQLAHDCQSPFATARVHLLDEEEDSRKLQGIGFKFPAFLPFQVFPCSFPRVKQNVLI